MKYLDLKALFSTDSVIPVIIILYYEACRPYVVLCICQHLQDQLGELSEVCYSGCFYFQDSLRICWTEFPLLDFSAHSSLVSFYRNQVWIDFTSFSYL